MSENRYAKTLLLTLTDPDGTEVTYYARRFAPQPETIAARGYAQALPGERSDILAWRTLRNPLLYWRIADANGVLNPDRLTALPGAQVKIPQDQS